MPPVGTVVAVPFAPVHISSVEESVNEMAHGVVVTVVQDDDKLVY